MTQSATGSFLNDLLGVDDVSGAASGAWAWLLEHVLVADVAVQVGLLIAALVPAALFGPRLKKAIVQLVGARTSAQLARRIGAAAAELATPFALLISMMAFRVALGAAGRPTEVISGAVSLLTAWIVIRLVTLLIRSPFWSRVAFFIAWPIAALDAFGALDDVAEQLRLLAIPLGTSDAGEPVDVSMLDVVRTLFYFALLFWGASAAGRLIENRIAAVEELTPSLRAMIVKIMNVILPIVALLIAMQIVGFNIGALTVFGGALGLGVGLGLQGAVSNFIAGFTLVADKSIKPGDVIEVDDTFGWVTRLHSRYVAIRTRDGTEHLVPNDKFVTEGVINWSHSDQVVRLHAPFGVSYDTADLRAVQAMAVEAASAVSRVVETPSPVCNLVGFGDSSVDFDLRFWIRDPANGMGNVRSQVLLELWDRLKAAGVEIPFPQRDLHVKSWRAPQSRPVPEPAPGDAT